MIYNFVKESFNLTKLYSEIKSVFSSLVSVSSSDSSIAVEFSSSLSSSEQEALQGIIDSHTTALTTEQSLNIVMKNAMAFGIKLIAEISAENILLGITQANMTNTVRKNAREILSALLTGSLYDAIHECKTLPEEAKDSTFITNARLLSAVNKIETYLGITLSEDLSL